MFRKPMVEWTWVSTVMSYPDIYFHCTGFLDISIWTGAGMRRSTTPEISLVLHRLSQRNQPWVPRAMQRNRKIRQVRKPRKNRRTKRVSEMLIWRDYPWVCFGVHRGHSHVNFGCHHLEAHFACAHASGFSIQESHQYLPLLMNLCMPWKLCSTYWFTEQLFFGGDVWFRRVGTQELCDHRLEEQLNFGCRVENL